MNSTKPLGSMDGMDLVCLMVPADEKIGKEIAL